MALKYKQSQFELFPKSSGNPPETDKPKYLFANLTLTFDNLVVVFIVIVMFLIFSFCWGVEKGKKITANPEQAQQEKITLEISETEETITVTDSKAKKLPMPRIEKEQIKSAPAVTDQAPPKERKRRFTIQVASFKTEKFANKEAQALKEKGYDIYVIPKGNYSIVCVGQFDRKDQAQDFSSKLKDKYKDFLIRRL